MTTQVGVGFSQQLDPYKAGRQAAEQAVRLLAGQPPNLLVLFTTHDRDPVQALSGVRAVAGEAALIGGCSAGIIVPQGAFNSGVAVLALGSDEIRAVADIATAISQDPAGSGQALMQRLMAGSQELPPAANGLVVTVTDNRGAGNAAIKALEALGEALPPHWRLIGGGAQDPSGRVDRPAFLHQAAYRDAMAGALLLTSGPVGVGVRHGYQPLGPLLVVTRAQGNTLYELDGRSAFEVYADHFPHHPGLALETFARFALDHPLGLPLSEENGEYIIRDPYAVGPDGSLLCAGMIPEKTQLRIMTGDRGTLVRAARQAAADASQQLKGRRPLLVMVFSCVSRLAYLGPTAPVEITTIRSVIGPSTPFIGLFSYGEVVDQAGSAIFHNKTVVVGMIGEA